MLLDLAKFLVIFGISFFIFSCIGTTLFRDHGDYESLPKTMLTLFKATLGDFDFDIFDDYSSKTLKYTGYAFMTTFLIYMMITLLNFVIAILSDTYAILTEKSTSLYLREIVYLQNSQGHVKSLSSIVSAWVPFNAIVLPVLPILLIFHRWYFVNTIMLHIMYLPVAVTVFVLQFAITTIFLPVAYLLSLSYKFKQLLFFRHRVGYCERIMVFVFWLLFGLFVLLGYMIVDMVLFVLNLYSTDLKGIRTENATNDHDLNAVTFMVLRQSLRSVQADMEEKYPDVE